MNNKRILDLVSLSVAVAGAILAVSNQIIAIKGLPGWLTCAWPAVLAGATLIDRVGNIFLKANNLPVHEQPETTTVTPLPRIAFQPTPKTSVITTKLAPCIAAFLCVTIIGCVHVDLKKGTYSEWGDSTNVDLKYGRNSYHHDTHSSSAVWDASGRFVGSVGSGVATALLGAGAAKSIANGGASSVQLLGAMPAIVHPVVNRRTNRLAPTTPIPLR